MAAQRKTASPENVSWSFLRVGTWGDQDREPAPGCEGECPQVYTTMGLPFPAETNCDSRRVHEPQALHNHNPEAAAGDRHRLALATFCELLSWSYSLSLSRWCQINPLSTSSAPVSPETWPRFLRHLKRLLQGNKRYGRTDLSSRLIAEAVSPLSETLVFVPVI